MITLIGTAHLDLDGTDRLKRALDYFSPKVIGIEATETGFKESLELIEKLSNEDIFENARKVFPNANLETLRLWLSSANYLIWVTNEYSILNKVPILYCDNPQEVDGIDWGEIFKNPKNTIELRNFFIKTPVEAMLDIEEEYSLQEYPVKDNLSLVEFYQKRDIFSEKVLRTEKQDIVYICGLDHIFGDYHPNLYNLLEDLNPKRMKLNQF